jgi:hypothetical protein
MLGQTREEGGGQILPGAFVCAVAKGVRAQSAACSLPRFLVHACGGMAVHKILTERSDCRAWIPTILWP